jgi:cell division protease FtsH
MPADNVIESESVEPADFEQTLKAVNEPEDDNLDNDLNKIENQDN